MHPRTNCLAGLILLIGTGCDSVAPLRCPEEVRPTMVVEVREALLEDSIAQGASGYIEDGEVRLDLQPAGDPLHFVEPSGRAGIYTVVVEKSGYEAFRVEGVEVVSDGCQVETVRVKADLEPTPLPESPATVTVLAEGLELRLTLSHTRVRANTSLQVTLEVHNPSSLPVRLFNACTSLWHSATYHLGVAAFGVPGCFPTYATFEIAGGATLSEQRNVRALYSFYDNQIFEIRRLRPDPGTYTFRAGTHVLEVDGRPVTLPALEISFEVE